MTRPPLAITAAIVLAMAGIAAGQGEPPVPAEPSTTPPPAERVSAAVDRDGRRMTLRVTYRMPPGISGTVPVEWRAFSGAREARTLPATGHGVAWVTIADGQLRFTRRALLGTALDRSGGFCVRPDFAAVAVAPVEPDCMQGARHRRADLTAHVPEVVVFGDSVAATFDWVPGTRDVVAPRASVRFDLRSCRRLIGAPCPPNPPSALASIRSLPGSLGDIAVIDVGYNDWPGSYDVPLVMRALRARGVDRVVWVLLRETQESYRGINREVRSAARRRRDIQVSDWGRFSRGRPWFVQDHVHLTSTGGWALARFMRGEIRTAVAHLRARGEE